MGNLLHSKGGSASWAGTGTLGAEITSWSLDVTADVAEITSMDDATWKQYLGGFKDWTATIETIWDDGDNDFVTAVGTGPSTLTLKMVSATHNIEAANGAICSGISFNCDSEGVMTLTWTFVADGVAMLYGAS